MLEICWDLKKIIKFKFLKTKIIKVENLTKLNFKFKYKTILIKKILNEIKNFKN